MGGEKKDAFDEALKALNTEIRRMRLRLTFAEGALREPIREISRLVQSAGWPGTENAWHYAEGARQALESVTEGTGPHAGTATREALLLAAVRIVLSIQALDAESEGGTDV